MQHGTTMKIIFACFVWILEKKIVIISLCQRDWFL